MRRLGSRLSAVGCGLWVVTVAVACPTSAAASQPAPLVISDVTIVDGTGAPNRAHMTVIIRNGRIAAIQPRTRRVPSDGVAVSGTGKFLIPGLWDMHVHLAKAGEISLALFVANGVTSVRDAGGDFALVQRWRTEINGGKRLGPRIRAAGPMLESAARVRRMKERGTVEPVDRFRASVADTNDARRVVDSVVRLGVDFVKVRTVASPDTYRAIARATQRAGLTLVAHGDVAAVETMLDAGQRSFEHAIHPSLQKRDSVTRSRLIRRMASARVAMVPTMVNYYQWLMVSLSDARRIVDDSLGRIDPRRRYITGYLLSDWREQVDERGAFKDAILRRFVLPRLYKGVLADLREMHGAGVPILPGTDVGVALQYPGFSLSDELRLFVERVGMTPLRALVSATRDAAEHSGMLDSLGTLEVGKLADLVLLDADPTLDIRNVMRIHAVVTRGQLVDRSRLDQLLVPPAR